MPETYHRTLISPQFLFSGTGDRGFADGGSYPSVTFDLTSMEPTPYGQQPENTRLGVPPRPESLYNRASEHYSGDGMSHSPTGGKPLPEAEYRTGQSNSHYTHQNTYDPLLPSGRGAGISLAQAMSLEQYSCTASAEYTKQRQEYEQRAMTISGVASPSHLEPMATSALPSIPSSSASLAKRRRGKKRRERRDREKGRTPKTRVRCSHGGCGKTFGRETERKRHEKTKHNNPIRWYCPGLDANYASKKKACECPDRGYCRDDYLLHHLNKKLRRNGPQWPCVQNAMVYGWHPNIESSVQNLATYLPSWFWT